jgi:poly(glycerol-phosphate) alpha-glucosyltransferase
MTTNQLSATLPRQFVTTWWIPEQYGGQTTATLRRVGEQARRSGHPVELLTFGALWDNAEAVARLKARGALDPGVTLRNLWEDLRAWEQAGVLHERLATLPQVEPAPSIDAREVSFERGPFGERSYDDQEELLRADSFRTDGSLLCREQPVLVDGKQRRHQQFFRPDGTPSVLLGSAWDFYYLWLDELIGAEPAVIVNESKSTARFMSRYANPCATVIHQFHESHLAHEVGDDPYKGVLGNAHRRLIPHLDRFDAVVFLTQQQRLDVIERFGGGANLHSVPNAGPRPVDLQTRLLDPSRRGDRGIVVATLKPLKRLDHAIRAVAAVRGKGRRPTLDIYGRDAGSGAELERVIAETGTRSAITLRGYTAHAARHFAEASFSLMTSLTEGQSLVLLESMAAGCVPISYDIRYGPEELIVHGETGFLVPAGDLEALVETIRSYLSLPSRKLRQLRRQCQERLTAFSDAEVYARWCAVQQAALTHSARRIILTGLEVRGFEIEPVGQQLNVSVRLRTEWDTTRWTAPDAPVPTAHLLLTGRRRGTPKRFAMQLEPSGGEPLWGGAAGMELVGSTLLDPALVQVGEQLCDVYVEVSCEATARQVRLKSDGDIAAAVPGGEVFATGYGNISMRLAQ